MKVLMTADTLGGTWTYALELADALADHGIEVSLAAMGGALRHDQRAQLRRSRIARTYVAEFALEWMHEPWRDVERAGEWLLEIADEVEPSLVHLNNYAHAPLPWGVPVIVVGHSDVLSWHRAVRGTDAGPEWTRYRELVARGLEAADLLVSPTRAMLDELVRSYEPQCPTTVIANGTSRRAAPRPKAPLVLTAGRLWDEAKNVASLVRVAPQLPWPVAVAGDGEVGPGVHALGRLGRDELDDALATAAIFAEPARYEPFGLAALEAALAGCALVLGDIPSLREVWGDAAVFVRDDDSLERALRLLIEDTRLRRQYAARARRRAAGYTPQRMAAGYLAAYAGLLRTEQAVAAG